MPDRRLFVELSEWGADQIVVRGEQAHHLKDVLRARRGDSFEFIDGRGRWARAVVEALPTRDEVKCRIEEQCHTAPWTEDRLVLLQALIRFEKFEWILEKAVELGVTKIVPVVAAHTEAKWREVTEARIERWRKILIESLKQCRRLHLPVLEKPVRFDQAVSTVKAAHRFLMSEKPDAPLLKSICSVDRRAGFKAPPAPQVAMAIGPAGGWANDEIRFAENSGFRPVSIGSAILRAETAAVAALVIAHYEFGS